jgi:hypothetical protein
VAAGAATGAAARGPSTLPAAGTGGLELAGALRSADASSRAARLAANMPRKWMSGVSRRLASAIVAGSSRSTIPRTTRT